MKLDYPPIINTHGNKDSTENRIETKKDSWFDFYIVKNEKFKVPKTTFPRPFLIQTNEKQYGILNKEGLYFTDPEDFDKVKDAFYGYQWLVGEMDSRANNNTHCDPMQVDYIGETLGKINEIFKKSKKISPAFISEKNNEDNPERFYEEFQSYLTLLDEENREKVEDYFNLKFGELSIKEQFYFLNFIKDKNEEEISPIKNITNKFGTNAFRTFLSIEQGGKEMGGKILALGEKLPEEVAQKVFAKYGELIDIADNTHRILEDILPKQVVNESQKEIFEIKESMLNRAKDLLCTFYDKKDNNSEKLLRDLERYKSEILLYADTYKKLKDSGRTIRLEDIKNTKIAVLSQEEKEKIAKNLWNITRANRPFIKEGTEEMINREKNFNLTIEKKNSNFYVLKHKDEVISFCSITPDENGDLYLESLNTESEVKGSQIGGAFLPAVLEKIKDLGKNIYGHVHAENPGALPYYERLGFKIQEIKEGGVLKYYEIKIPASQELKKAA